MGSVGVEHSLLGGHLQRRVVLGRGPKKPPGASFTPGGRTEETFRPLEGSDTLFLLQTLPGPFCGGGSGQVSV